MQFSKNQISFKESPCTEIETKLSNVLWPFEYQIYKRKINVYIFKKQKFDFTMISDWGMYELILFNII